jgi:hypothetical protein
VRAAIEDGRFDDAARAYFALGPRSTRGVLTAEESLALTDWLRKHGHAQAALTALQRHLRDFPRGPGLAEAHLAAGHILLEDLGQPTPAYQHFLGALDANPSPEIARLARQGIADVEGRQKRQVGYLRPRRVR